MGQVIQSTRSTNSAKKVAHMRPRNQQLPLNATPTTRTSTLSHPRHTAARPVGSANRAYLRIINAMDEMDDCDAIRDTITHYAPYIAIGIIAVVFLLVMNLRMDAMQATYIASPAGVIMYVLDGAVYGLFAALPTVPIVMLAIIGAHHLVQRRFNAALFRKFAAEDRYYQITGRYPDTFDLDERLSVPDLLS